MRKIAFLLIIVLPCVSAASDRSPYVGQEIRSIKSLSRQEIESLRRGYGMGFAKLAELNNFPGPKHVLEISDDLELSPAQIASTRILYEEMLRNAVTLGEKLLSAESSLDQAFQNKTVDAGSLEIALHEIGRIRAQLRYVHLEAHLRQKQLLTPEQISRYDALRGYGK